MPRDQGLVLLGRCAMDLPHAPSRPLSRYARNASHVRQRSDDHLQDAARDHPASRWRSSRRDNLHPARGPTHSGRWHLLASCSPRLIDLRHHLHLLRLCGSGPAAELRRKTATPSPAPTQLPPLERPAELSTCPMGRRPSQCSRPWRELCSPAACGTSSCGSTDGHTRARLDAAESPGRWGKCNPPQHSLMIGPPVQ